MSFFAQTPFFQAMVSQESAIISIVSLRDGRGNYEYVGDNISLEVLLMTRRAMYLPRKQPKL